MGRLSRHHMLHAPRQAPLGHFGLGVHLHQKGALRRQGVDRICWPLRRGSGPWSTTLVSARAGTIARACTPAFRVDAPGIETPVNVACRTGRYLQR